MAETPPQEYDWEPRVLELKEQEIPAEDIAKLMFEEFPDVKWVGAPFKRLGELLGMKPMDLGRLKGRIAREKKKAEGGKEIPPPPGGGPSKAPASMEGLTEREMVAFYGEEGLDRVKRERLSRLLEHSPESVSAKSRDWIMDQWDTNETVRRSPNELFRALRDSGVKEPICHRIVTSLISLENEYADVLDNRMPTYYGGRTPRREGGAYYPEREYGGYEPPYYEQPGYPRRVAPQGYRGPPSYQTWPGYPQYPYTPPPGDKKELTLEEISKMMDEKLRKANEETRLDRTENAVSGIGNQLDEFVKRVDQFQESVKRGEVGAPKSPEKTLTAEDVIKAAGEASTKAVQEYAKTRDTEDKAERRHQELIASNKELLTAVASGRSAAVAGAGWQTDEGRIIGMGLNELGGAIRERQPVKVVIEGFPKIFGTTQPAPKEVEAGAESTLEKYIPREYVK